MPPNVCRICLATGVRMATIGALQPVYEKLAGVALHTNQRPMVACYICHALLTKAQRLMFRAITAENALQALLNVCTVITETSVSAVDRSAAGLCPSLSVSKLEYLDNIQRASGAEVKTENRNNHVNGVSENDLEGSVSSAAVSDVESESDGEAVDSSINPRADVEGSVSAAAASDVESEKECEAADSSINSRAEVEDMDARCSEGSEDMDRHKNTQWCETKGQLQKSVETHRKYDCDLCQEQFSDRTGLNRHIREKHTSDSFRCNICQHECHNRQVFRRHLKTHIDSRKCNICQREFSSHIMLERHMSHHAVNKRTTIKTKSYKCQVCDREFLLKRSLSCHLRMHKAKRDPKRVEKRYHQCPSCPYRSDNSSNVKAHLKTHESQRVACTVCNLRVSTKTALRFHMKLHKETFFCSSCRMSFVSNDAFQSHMAQHQPDEKETEPLERNVDSNSVKKRKYRCHICPYRSEYSSNVSVHLKTHVIQKVTCSVCNLRVSSKAALHYHMKLHKDLEMHTAEPDSNRDKKRIYQCHICPYRSDLSSNVNNHLKTHLIQKIACAVCNLRVSTKLALHHHMKLHKNLEMHTAEPNSKRDNKRIYRCHICPYRSTHLRNVNVHLKTHSIQKVECTVCKLRVSNVAALRHHMKLHKDSNRVKKRIYQCHICPYRSNLSGSVKNHLKTHLIQKVACALCDLRVSSKTALHHHMKLHKDGFYCAACRRSFATRDALQTHISSHEPDEKETEEQVAATSGDKLQCSLCPMRFNLKIAFRRHVISEHL